MILVHGVKKVSECTLWTCSEARRHQVTCRGLSSTAADRCWQVEGATAVFLKSQSRGCRAARSSLLSVLGIGSPKSLASVMLFSTAVAVRILGGSGSSDCRDKNPNMEIFQMWSEPPRWCIRRLRAVKEWFWWLWRSKHYYFNFSGLILPGDEVSIFY